MHDIIIVGAGVAGCYAASLLPDGLDIILLEKHKKVLPKDSGLVSKRFDSFIRDKRLIKNEVSKIECVSPSGKKFSLTEDSPFLYVLRRQKFAEHLRKLAKKRSTIKFEAASEVIHRKDCVSVRTDGGEYDAKMVIGCDGAKSIVRKSMGIRPPDLAAGVMVKSKKKSSDDIRVFFNKYYSPDFFSWSIPQNKEYGLISAIRPAEYLRFFAKKEGLPGGKIYAHMIPMGFTKSFGNRALLVGDSCGQNKPLTGGGIIYSLISASIAARTVRDAFEKETFSSFFLSKYESEWKQELGAEISRQVAVRKIYRKLTNKDIDKLFDDFGGGIGKLRGFDYDKFSMHLGGLPKWKLLKFAISKGYFAF